MEENISIKSKSVLEKFAPIILLIGIVFLAYFLFTKFKSSTPAAVNNPGTTTSSNVQVFVDTDFLMSEEFTRLKYIPDSSIFNEVTGVVNSGKDDPFAPIK